VLDLYKGDKLKTISVIAIFVVLVIGLIALTNISSNILTGLRGYIAAEAHWSKAQKNATQALTVYLFQQNSEQYSEFEKSLEVIEGYRDGRETLQTETPDFELASNGFIRGNSRPDEVIYMVRLFNLFQDYSYLSEAIQIWTEGDKKINELETVATEISAKIETGNLAEQERDLYLSRIITLDNELTSLENNFSTTIIKASHEVNNLLYWITLIFGSGLIITGGIITVGIIRNTKKWNRKLSEAQNRLQKIIENSGDVIYLMDLETRRYNYMSPSVEKMLGYSAEIVKRGGPEFIFDKTHPEDLKSIKKKFKELGADDLESQININTEFRVERSDGEYVWVNNKRTLIHDADEKPVAVVGNVRDISERKKHEDEIDQSLKEKQILLQEIHHRVKNNLAIISSLLELQKDGVDEDVQEIFKETQSRIQSIALVHEKLYQSDTLAEISLSDYMSELTDVISQAYGSSNRKVTLDKDLDELRMNITDAVPLGLMFNELVNNAYKHAFKGKEEGTLKISLKKNGESCLLSVADNGNGLPENFKLEEQQSLGMTLITALTSQLDADVNISSDEWTKFEIDFKLDHH